jgi:hypothetical protein
VLLASVTDARLNNLEAANFVGEFKAVHKEAEQAVVENTVTGKSFVIAHSDIVVNFSAPMVRCDDLTHILAGADGL